MFSLGAFYFLSSYLPSSTRFWQEKTLEHIVSVFLYCKWYPVITFFKLYTVKHIQLQVCGLCQRCSICLQDQKKEALPEKMIWRAVFKFPQLHHLLLVLDNGLKTYRSVVYSCSVLQQSPWRPYGYASVISHTFVHFQTWNTHGRITFCPLTWYYAVLWKHKTSCISNTIVYWPLKDIVSPVNLAQTVVVARVWGLWYLHIWIFVLRNRKRSAGDIVFSSVHLSVHPSRLR